MTRPPAIFSIPPVAPFLPTLAASLLDGRLVGPFDLNSDPLALARATIFLPTRRAARAFAAELAARIGPTPVLLPRIVPLGDMDEAEGALRADAAQPLVQDLPDLPPPIAAQERLILLTRLVLRWARAVAAAQGPRAAHEALLVAATPADAYAMASELAGLIDTLAIEGRGFADIEAVVPDRFDAWWDITRKFLAIAAGQWPNILAARGATDAAVHRDLMIRGRAALYQRGHESPVVAAGSTGSMPATAELLAAIARLPRGAVVLPGLDTTLDAAAFAAIAGDPATGAPPQPSHPQALLARLLAAAGVPRDAVVTLGDAPDASRGRVRLLSEAMRPAETTDAWSRLDAAADDLAAGLDGVAMVEAADEAEEALAVAVALREAIESPGKTAALVTPDRLLAERVTAALGRWRIEIDDSAGRPLGDAPAGLVARLVATLAARFDAPALLDLLGHPDVTLGLDRATLAAGAAALEIGVLRGRAAHPDSLADLAARLADARRQAAALHPTAAAHRLGPARWAAAATVVERLQAVFAPFEAFRRGTEAPISDIARAHRAACEEVFGGMSDAPDRVALDLLFAGLDRDPDDGFSLARSAWPALFDRLAADIAVHPPARAHRRLKIWGVLEARLLDADRIVAAGLVEGVWPPVARTDPFLNRGMRADIGLPSPERRLGQSAHDFVAACGGREVVLTTSAKSGGSPAVRSRFLRRLETCVGPESPAWIAAKARGARYLALARALDRPAAPAPAVEKPAPKPPAALQPLRLSVTRIETLVRDPYAIFAEHVLGLQPLEPLLATIDGRIMGTLAHRAIEIATQMDAVAFPDAARRFRVAARRVLDEAGLPARLRAFFDARFDAFARSWARFEDARRPLFEKLAVETRGRTEFPLADGAEFTLSAEADRIEALRDGAFAIFDFKTGTLPGAKEVAVGYAPQLSLEAAMLGRGAFPIAPKGARVATLCLVKLAGDGGEPKIVDLGAGTARTPGMDLAAKPEEHVSRLVGLLDELRAGRRGFVSRRYPRKVRDDAPTNHLARVQEWSREGAGET